ncbi:hypothetical protein GGF31_005711 [Allomyces arbusculus]|nr:hypothetical protein GGF31_005711 [Allomyces arbusculus]
MPSPPSPRAAAASGGLLASRRVDSAHALDQAAATTTKSGSAPIELLPLELLDAILARAAVRDRVQCSAVSRALHTAAARALFANVHLTSLRQLDRFLTGLRASATNASASVAAQCTTHLHVNLRALATSVAAALRAIVAACPYLEVVTIEGLGDAPMADAALNELVMPQLRSITVRGATYASDAWLTKLAFHGADKLESLTLDRTAAITATGALAHLHRMPHLRSLTISNCARLPLRDIAAHLAHPTLVVLRLPGLRGYSWAVPPDPQTAPTLVPSPRPGVRCKWPDPRSLAASAATTPITTFETMLRDQLPSLRVLDLAESDLSPAVLAAIERAWSEQDPNRARVLKLRQCFGVAPTDLELIHMARPHWTVQWPPGWMRTSGTVH